MGFRTLIIEKPCRLSYQGGYLVARQKDNTTKIHLSELSCIVLQTTQAYISAYLLAELANNKISFVGCDQKHNPAYQSMPLHGSHNCSGRIREQIAWGEPIKKRVWQTVVKEKIAQQAAVLETTDLEKEAKLLRSCCSEVRSGDATNREGYAARVYFSALFGPEFTRDSDCAINAALNYGYSIVLSLVNREIVSRGYLTQMGICHRSEYNQFNLGCDFMEPFRPMIDRLVVDYFDGDFNKEFRRLLADVGNCTVSYKDGSYKLSSVISLYVQDCLSALNKQISVDQIKGYEAQ